MDEDDKFHGVDAAGVKINVGDTCKVIRHWNGYRKGEVPIGRTFEVDVVEVVGYDGDLTVGVLGDGWIHHKSVLVV